MEMIFSFISLSPGYKFDSIGDQTRRYLGNQASRVISQGCLLRTWRVHQSHKRTTSLSIIAPRYCGGVEARSKSGRRYAVTETEMTGETDGDP